MSERDFDGKVIAVTGAGAGLGAAVASAFAAGGACVVCNDVDAGSVRQTVAHITDAGGSAAASVGDAGAPGDVQAMVDTARREFGGLDVMYANAAISIYNDLEATPVEDLDRIIDVNLKGPLLCARAAIPVMRDRGGGSIIFVSSVQGFQGLRGCVPYAAAKAGLVAAARTLAAEVGHLGIRVNAIAPGTFDTPMFQRDLAPMNAEDRTDFLDRVNRGNALGRVGDGREIAEAALFLASPRASYVTGTCLVVDGGFLSVKAF